MNFKIGDIVVLGGYQPATIVGIVRAGRYQGNFECQWTDTIGVRICMNYDADTLRAHGNVPHRYGSHYRPSLEQREQDVEMIRDIERGRAMERELERRSGYRS